MAMEKMKSIFIRDNQTGKIKLSNCQLGGSFWWLEGNSSCDCNRALYFGYDDNREFPCSGTRFDIVNEDGTEYNDWEDDDYNKL